MSKKVLYERKGVEDNYTDEQFLSSLRMKSKSALT